MFLTLFLDIIWWLNFLFDSLLLYMTGLVLKRPVKRRRIFFGGLVGSLMIFTLFTPVAGFFASPFVKAGISFIMVWIAFGFKRPRFFLTNVSVFYLITFLSGGGLIGLHYLFNFNFDMAGSVFMANINGFGDPISWLFVTIAFPLIYYFTRQTFDSWETAKIHFDQLVPVQIQMNGQIVKLIGLIDSGNHLYDPLTKRPVMIVSLEKTPISFPRSC